MPLSMVLKIFFIKHIFSTVYNGHSIYTNVVHTRVGSFVDSQPDEGQ